MVNSSTIIQNEPAVFVPEQWRYIIKLYADSYLKSKVIDINAINYDLFFYLSVDNTFHKITRKYHGKDWEYIKDHSRNMLIMK
ncbi:MAG: hypothetical protein HQK72_17770 [Desulfamplus sp.]|nr:hypothetical protein [Desulfamplus sp.]